MAKKGDRKKCQVAADFRERRAEGEGRVHSGKSSWFQLQGSWFGDGSLVVMACNVTASMTLLDHRHQAYVRDMANRYPGLVVVRNKGLIRMWAGDRPIDQEPLVRHLTDHFVVDEEIGEYELMKRRGTGRAE